MTPLARKRAAKVRAGICRDCSRRADAGKRFCVACLKRIRTSNNKRFQDLKAKRVCVWCGKRPAKETNDCTLCAKRRRRNIAAWWAARKIAVFNAYGGSICVCCQETRIEFLTIDHIHGGGTRHRTEVNATGSSFYTWLKKNRYPPGFRVLCANCNFSHGHFGYCPHENEK